MAIEIKTKRNIKINWVTWLFIISGILFLFFLFTYLFFVHTITKNNEYIETEIKKLEEKIAEEPLEEELTKVKNKINKINSLLFNNEIIKKDGENLIFTVNKIERIFQFLSDNIHPNVWFFSVDYNKLQENKVTISGEAENLTSLKQQLVILENKLKEDLSLTDYQIGDPIIIGQSRKNQSVLFTFDFIFDTNKLP